MHQRPGLRYPLVRTAAVNSNQSSLGRSLSVRLEDSTTTELKHVLEKLCNRPSLIDRLSLSSEEGRFPGMEDYELALVQVVTRHGDRSPIYKTPLNNPRAFRCPQGNEYFSLNESDLKFSCGSAMLTLTGCRQHQAIGRHLQKSYRLRAEELESKMLIISTGLQRTVRSALCLASGLLGHTGYDQVTKMASTMFRDNPIRDTGYAKSCPGQDKLWGHIHNEMTYQTAAVEWTRVKSKVNRFVTDLGYLPIQDIVHLFDSVVCHYCYLYTQGVHASITPCIGNHCLPASSALEIIQAAELSTKHNYDPKVY